MADDKDVPKKDGEVARWLDEIERAQNTTAMKRWSDRCKKIRDKYRYESSRTAKVRQYQMLWSNMETMKPSVYTKPPQGVVQQRNKDRDPVAGKATEMLERGINFTVDAQDFNSKFEKVRDDYLLYARGMARVKYKPVYDTVTQEAGQPDDAAIDPAKDAKEEAQEPYASPETILKFENCVLEYVQREDFVHSISRTWDEVEWEAFRGYLGRKQLVKRFGEEIGGKIPLDAGPDKQGENRREGAQLAGEKATIWEIWDKENNRVLWIAKGYDEVLEEGPPYLKFEGFFPNPQPAYGTLTNDSLEPIPDYIFYKDQADEIDVLTARIASLSESLKLVGFYPAGPKGEGAPEIERAVTPGFENRMIAVKSWAMFAEGGKGGAPIIWLPVEHVIKVLESCVSLRKQLIDDVYQIYGLSDIMRGDSDPRETAKAQGIKAQFGSVRIRERQKEMARFCRDCCSLVGEIISTCFSPETLMKMANIKLPTEAEVQAEQLAAQQQALIAQAKQQAMMGHNGGPPMQEQPQQAPMGVMQ